MGQGRLYGMVWIGMRAGDHAWTGHIPPDFEVTYRSNNMGIHLCIMLVSILHNLSYIL